MDIYLDIIRFENMQSVMFLVVPKTIVKMNIFCIVNDIRGMIQYDGIGLTCVKPILGHAVIMKIVIGFHEYMLHLLGGAIIAVDFPRNVS